MPESAPRTEREEEEGEAAKKSKLKSEFFVFLQSIAQICQKVRLDWEKGAEEEEDEAAKKAETVCQIFRLPDWPAKSTHVTARIQMFKKSVINHS